MNLKKSMKAREESKNTKFASQATKVGKNFRSISLEDLFCESQVRTSFSDLDSLAASLKEVGQQQPITVSYDREKQKYLIIQGERRYRAAKIAGLKALDAVVLEKAPYGVDRSIVQLTENLSRESMNPFDIAIAIATIQKEAPNESKESLSRKLGISHVMIHAYLGVASLPEDVFESLKESGCGDAIALYNIAKACKVDSAKTRTLLKTALVDLNRKSSQVLLDAVSGKDNSAESSNAKITSVKQTKKEIPEGFDKRSFRTIAKGKTKEGRVVEGELCTNLVDLDNLRVCLVVDGKLVPVSVASLQIKEVK